MRGINLSKCRKVSQDKQSAVFKHGDGHEIRIALSGLTPSLRKELSELPLYKKDGGAREDDMSDLEDDDDEVEDDLDKIAAGKTDVSPAGQEAGAVAPVEPEAAPASTAPAAQAGPGAGLAPTGLVNPPVAGAPGAVMPPAPSQPPTEASAQSATPQAPAPEQPVADAIPETPAQRAQKKFDETMKLAEDMSQGKIKAKTYHDLFAEKSTLGKIGMIFGTLLSGMGSGLAKQPNMMFEMMNKEIERDLESQKESAKNKQSWYTLQMAHDKLQPELAGMWAETSSKATDAAVKQWNAKELGIQDLSHSTNALNNMTAAYMQKLQDDINKMPPGPMRDQAQQVFSNQLVPFQMAVGMRRLIETEQKTDLLRATNPKPQPPTEKSEKKQGAKAKESDYKSPDFSENTVNNNKYQEMIKNGEMRHKNGVFVDPKKGIDPGQLTKVENAITKSKVNWAMYRDTMEMVQKLHKMENAGESWASTLGEGVKDIPWVGKSMAQGLHVLGGAESRDRDQLVNAIKARLVSSGASNQTIHDVAEALTPSKFDKEETRSNLPELIYQHFNSTPAEKDAVFITYPGIKNKLPKIPLEGKMGDTVGSGAPKKKLNTEAPNAWQGTSLVR